MTDGDWIVIAISAAASTFFLGWLIGSAVMWKAATEKLINNGLAKYIIDPKTGKTTIVLWDPKKGKWSNEK